MAERAIVHVDMDAFFASVEQRDNPQLRGRPVLVGARRRGVVCAASYEARVFGCRSAMAMSQALRLCPHAEVVSPRFSAYKAASQAVFAIFRRFTPEVEALSLDEAFLDVSGGLKSLGPATVQAEAIRAAIRAEVRLPSSAGVAPNKFVAKLASVWAKPNGLAVVTPDEVERRLAPLKLGQMFGVGPKMVDRLRALGLLTFADLRAADPAGVAAAIGQHEAAHFIALAWGRDERPVRGGRQAKSVGSEHTLSQDCSTKAELRPLVLHQCLKVAAGLAHKGLFAGGVRLKLKSASFVLESRQATFASVASVTSAPDALFAAAQKLLAAAPLPPGGVRLVGIAAISLTDKEPLPELFANVQQDKRAALEQARLAIDKKFGAGRLTRALVFEGRRQVLLPGQLLAEGLAEDGTDEGSE